MLRFISRYKTTVVGFLTLILPLALLWYHARPRQGPTIYERTLLRFTSPAQLVMGTVIGSVRGVWTDYIWLVGVQEDNHRLTSENEQLIGKGQEIDRLRKEKNALAEQLHYKGKRNDLETISARVVAKDVSPYHRVVKVRISAGEDHGARRYMPVITPVGVVGFIDNTVGQYAEVKLAVDAGSRISVNVRDREIKGTLAGAGDRNTFDASFVTTDPKNEIRPGDVLVTNGEDEIFPEGLVVGSVLEDEPTHEEAGLRYIVRPAVDFKNLQHVMIVTHTNPGPPRMEDRK